jgi:hypothetical protein
MFLHSESVYDPLCIAGPSSDLRHCCTYHLRLLNESTVYVDPVKKQTRNVLCGYVGVKLLCVCCSYCGVDEGDQNNPNPSMGGHLTIFTLLVFVELVYGVGSLTFCK